jgi:hypothetical protein
MKTWTGPMVWQVTSDGGAFPPIRLADAPKRVQRAVSAAVAAGKRNGAVRLGSVKYEWQAS